MSSESNPVRGRRTALRSLYDLLWRLTLRFGFRLVRLWWEFVHPSHEGAQVAVFVGPDLLLVRQSYRAGWHLPGGGVKRGETPEAAARRELAEEIGIVAPALAPVGRMRYVGRTT